MALVRAFFLGFLCHLWNFGCHEKTRLRWNLDNGSELGRLGNPGFGGRFFHVSLERDDLLCGALGINLNPAGTHLVVSAPNCGTVILYRRDVIGLSPAN